MDDSNQEPFPRVTTRGYYSLLDGSALKRGRYYLSPAPAFGGIMRSGEIVLVVHGLRNDRAAAVEKFRLCRGRLRELGYGFPVVGFSYDSNTRGAHLRRHERRALEAGLAIAEGNGWHLAEFVADFARSAPGAGVRLVGHSLGSNVVLSALRRLVGSGVAVESVHFFGSSIPASPFVDGLDAIAGSVRDRILNYYCPRDEVLLAASRDGLLEGPLGLCGLKDGHDKYAQVMVQPEDHRFASYLQTLDSFP